MRKQSLQQQLAEARRQNTAFRGELDYLRRLTNSVRDGLWHRDLQNGKLSLTKHWWERLGYSESEIPNDFREFLLLVHQDDRKMVEESVRRHLEGYTNEYESRFRLKNSHGEYRIILSRGIRTPFDSVTPLYIAGSHTDITEIEKENEQEAHLFHIYENILKTIPHLILIKDRYGRFVYVNEALARFYGAEDPKEMIGRKDKDYNKNEEQVSQFKRDDWEAIQQGETILISHEENTNSKGVVHHLSTVKAPIKNLDGTTYVVVAATFIDELVKTQDDLLAATEREKKLKVIQQLAGQIAHKLNTRIATVENRVLGIANQESPYFASTLQSLDDVKRFAKDFLKLSLANQLKYNVSNLVKIVQKAINMSDNGDSRILINGIPWRKHPREDEKFRLLGDEAKLLDVFAELISNSIQWSGDRDHTILIDFLPIVKKMQPTFGPPPPPDYLKVTFRDNGPGIGKDDKRKIFEPFFSTRTEGTGLGLTMVRDVIEAHGGKIAEHGVPQSGVCFEILLPTLRHTPI